MQVVKGAKLIGKKIDYVGTKEVLGLRRGRHSGLRKVALWA